MRRSMSEWISNLFTQRVTTFARRATAAFVSSYWADQNNQTDEVQVNQAAAQRAATAAIVSSLLPDRNNQTDEVVSNGNAEVRDDETIVDISNTAAILIPQTSIAAQAIWNPRNWPQGGLSPRPNAGRGIDIQALLITEGKWVAKLVISISATGIFSAVPEVVGTKEAHEYIFTAFIILCYVSLVSGLALNHLIRISPETRGFVKIVKFTIYFCQGTLLYAISCVVCLVFPSKFGVVFILVAPPIPFGLIAILSSARWGQGSIP